LLKVNLLLAIYFWRTTGTKCTKSWGARGQSPHCWAPPRVFVPSHSQNVQFFRSLGSAVPRRRRPTQAAFACVGLLTFPPNESPVPQVRGVIFGANLGYPFLFSFREILITLVTSKCRFRQPRWLRSCIHETGFFRAKPPAREAVAAGSSGLLGRAAANSAGPVPSARHTGLWQV